MKNFLLGLGIGLSCAGILLIWHNEKIRFARGLGYSEGVSDVIFEIREEFGEAAPEDYRVVYRYKDAIVIAVQRNGVKTIRIYKHRQIQKSEF